MMKLHKYKSYLLALSLLGSIGFMSIFYELLNHDRGHARFLYSPIDQLIPLVPGMTLPYILWYPFIFLAMAFLCLYDRPVYYRILITMNICLAVCYFIYYHFQTSVPRPYVSPTSWSRRLLLSLYNRDKPFNCFPSIHALHSYLVMRGAWASKKIANWMKWLISICAVTIILSTLMIKQHVIYDSLSAILLGETVFALVCAFWFAGRKRTNWRQSFH